MSLKTVVFLCGLLAVASFAAAADDEFVFAEMVESTSNGERAMLPAAVDASFAPQAMASPYSGYFPRMMEQVPAAAAPAVPPAAGAVPPPPASNPNAPATAAYAYYNYPYSTAPPVPPPMPTYLPLPPYVPTAEVLSLGV